MSDAALISIVDDDGCMREAMRSLIRSVGFRAETFDSAEAFLRCEHLQEIACLILDVRMPGRSGLELQRELSADGYRIPIIFVSAHGENGTRREALEAGAVDFLPKPFREDALLRAIQSAVRDE